jgi:hypothetical protein
MLREIGALKRVDAREVWTNEARDFTPWLKENIALLGEKLGMDLDLVEGEVSVGPFAADLVAKDVSGDRWVVIENQLEPTDHGHLGQLLTYGAGTWASVFVWISPEFREEHRAALDWLNEHSDEDSLFFGVEIELVAVDDSRPAPYFKLVSFPNEWRKSAHAVTAPVSEKRAAYEHFWAELIPAFKAKYPGQTNVSRPPRDSWLSLGAGRTGLGTNWAFTGDRRFRVELYIDTGDGPSNKAYFDQLAGHKDEIELKLGHELNWDRIEERQACRISSYYPQQPVSVTDDEDTLRPLIDWAVEEMARFRSAFRPNIQTLRME